MRKILRSKQVLLRLRTLSGRTSARINGCDRVLDLEQAAVRAAIVDDRSQCRESRALLSTKGDKR